MQLSVNEYLNSLLNELLSSPRLPIGMTRSWASQLPKANGAGVYIIWRKETIIYAGETGNLCGRMRDLTDTRNHNLRRSIGSILYADRVDYTKPSASRRFCDAIESDLNAYISSELTLSFLPIELGRKELEEKIIKDYEPEYNRKGSRFTV